MVYYRKYRPQTISELDLVSVRKKLYSMLASDNVPHAFLFTGPKGLGKTSSARILAKAINCETRIKQKTIPSKKEKESKAEETSYQDLEPCNTCSSCISITNGSNIDVLEIDAASNRGIDEMRELRERIKFAPASLPQKVYIIDEVHMLTTEAFNALLKTLEEPPSHVVFILATTEHWKLPATIVSRTFHIQFEKPTLEEQIRALSRIVTGEKLDIEEGVLEKVVSLADGAFRDGAKILEELAFGAHNKKITKELLEETHKTDSIEGHVIQLLTHVSQKDAKGALLVIQELSQNGCDFKIVIEKTVEVLRFMLLTKNGIQSADTKNIGKSIAFDSQSLEKLLGYLNSAYKDIRVSVLPQLPLELAIAKFCIVDTQELKTSFPISRTETEEKKEFALPHRVKNEIAFKPSVHVTPTPQSNPVHNGNGISSHVKPTIRTSPPQSLSGQTQNDEFLKSLIERVKKDNFSIAGVLRSTKVSKMDENKIEIMTPFKFHGEKLHSAVSLLKTHASEILGKNIDVVVLIQEK